MDIYIIEQSLDGFVVQYSQNLVSKYYKVSKFLHFKHFLGEKGQIFKFYWFILSKRQIA